MYDDLNSAIASIYNADKAIDHLEKLNIRLEEDNGELEFRIQQYADEVLEMKEDMASIQHELFASQEECSALKETIDKLLGHIERGERMTHKQEVVFVQVGDQFGLFKLKPGKYVYYGDDVMVIG